MTKYATVDPVTGRRVLEFNTMTDGEAEGAVTCAQDAYMSWNETDLRLRTDVLLRIADLHRKHAQELAKLMTLEMGKPILQARKEVEQTASIYEYYATKGPELLRDEELETDGSGRAIVKTVSVGPLLGIMPWNYPYYQVGRFVAPNLLLGNTILLKHASSCPQQALRIAEIIEEAGAPVGVYQNLFASNDQIAGMIGRPEVRGISLTGSERAGRIIGSLAGQHLKKCVLELGGSDPFIVLPQADLNKAVDAAVTARFNNAGQACTSSKRLIVHESLWDEFLQKFVAKTSEWKTGDPAQENTLLGPMSSVAARSDLASQVDDAVAKGATVHLGGTVPEGDGAYYPATVLSGITPDMRAYYEELFGPVAMLHKVGSTQEAIKLANDSPYGLGSTVFTRDIKEANYLADQLEVGMVALNTTIRSEPNVPFGGVKNSGIGRELGRFGLDEFANKKLVRLA
jgi:acyl-CoA reductase-like NAD-dependent aldehyde dehydrogenase